MPAGSNWTRDELLVALRVYLGTPFGRLDQGNPEIIDVARTIGRTPSAVAMQTSNFANLDPNLDRKGLSNTSEAGKELWAEFEANPEQIAYEAETVAESLNLVDNSAPGQRLVESERSESADQELVTAEPTSMEAIREMSGPTESERFVRVRRVQAFFRSAILISYKSRCAMTGLSMPSLLVASHIIPWSDDIARRADPRNGLCLSALFDRAFDRGLITFDEDLRLLLSPALEEHLPPPRFPCVLTAARGERMNLPHRLTPDPEALEYHRENVFCG